MYLGAYIRYKTYRGTIRANILSMASVFFQVIFCCCLCFVVLLLTTTGNPNYEYHLPIVIPIIIAIALISFIINVVLKKLADKLGIIDFENKVKNDFEFTKKMAKENLQNKEWYINRNLKYAEYVSSGKEALEKTMKKSSRNKINDTIRNIVGFTLLILFFLGVFYFLRSL